MLAQLDGAPVCEPLVSQLTNTLRFRGPDALHTWTQETAGLGHALFRSTDEAADERQPCTFDGRTWIVGHVRIDGRGELVELLRATGRDARRGRPDIELVLHAWHAWGERCVERLIGDFAFAIRDGERQRIFAARDQIGIRPLYYSHRPGRFLLIGNTLRTLQHHPEVSADVNEAAIADFLAFGYGLDPGVTAFRDILMLPAAHTLMHENGKLRVERYWDFPVREPLRLSGEEEYLERFRRLLGNAVEDRSRTDRLGIFLSGGLDSPALAATVIERILPKRPALSFQAVTVVYEHLMPDDERSYAERVARHLGIPLEVVPADDFGLFEHWGERHRWRPRPQVEPESEIWEAAARRLAAHGRVALNGEDPDTLLAPATLTQMLSGLPASEVVGDVARFVLSRRTLPPLGLGVMTRVRRTLGRQPHSAGLPPWVPPALDRRFHLRERLAGRARESARGPTATEHRYRPAVLEALRSPIWPWFLESLDPGVTGVPLEVGFPFLDLRLVEYLLAVPPLPWCHRKHILRASMRGRLPSEILGRRKTPLQGDPYTLRLRTGQARFVDGFRPEPELANFVDTSRIPSLGTELASGDADVHLRPLALNHWLRHRRPLDRPERNDP